MRIVLIAEDQIGYLTATLLVDRVLIECGPDWIDWETVASLREWSGLDTMALYSKWKDLRQIADTLGISVHGRSEGPDYAAARRAFALAFHISEKEPLDVLVLARDMDNQPTRRGGLEAARSNLERSESTPPFAVIIAAADPEGEAWILNGFSPECDAEKGALELVKARLRFDPTQSPGKLRGDRRHDGAGATLDIKRVLAELAGVEQARRERCLISSPMSVLVERGRSTGLTEFLSEVKARLVPRLDPAPARPCDVP